MKIYNKSFIFAGEIQSMRNNKLLQSAADAIAQKNGYYSACFVGHYYEFALFSPLCVDSRPDHIGAPCFILVDKNGDARFVMDFSNEFLGSFDIIDKGTWCDAWRRGKRLYDKMMVRLSNGYCSDDTKPYLEYLKSVNKFEDFYIYLEAAERLGNKIVVGKDTSDDERSYYVKIDDIDLTE